MSDALIELGRTAAAAALLEPVATAPITRIGYVAAAHLLLLDGELGAAQTAWQELDRITVSSINFRTEFEQRRVELELWLNNPRTAFDRALVALEAARDNDERSSSGVLLVLALRSVADQAAIAQARRDQAAAKHARDCAERLSALHSGAHTDPLVLGPGRPAGDALRATWDAEWARISGEDGASAWSTAAEARMNHGRPHRVAYALFRQGEAQHARRGQRARTREVLTRAAQAAATHVPPPTRSPTLPHAPASISLSNATSPR